LPRCYQRGSEDSPRRRRITNEVARGLALEYRLRRTIPSSLRLLHDRTAHA
jgi:hypothetical protein